MKDHKGPASGVSGRVAVAVFTFLVEVHINNKYNILYLIICCDFV